MLYEQHLLGIGHLKRSATLADAMTRAGLEVTFVSGGFEVPGIAINAAHTVQLPPAGAADLSFKALVDAQGRPVDARWKEDRCALLLEVWRSADPHALLIELFPFGRRQMRFELVPLLEAARSAAHRPVVVCSVRDVLGGGQKAPARQDQMLELFERYFDHVLVHGDPAVIPFDATFRHAARLGDKLHYTGYVVDQARPEHGGQPASQGEVLVSVGGGAVGLPLLEAALLARPLCALAARPWRVLAGVQVADADLAWLAALAGAHGGNGVVVERNRPDFAQLLAGCHLSISQGGYNTVMETLAAGVRAVVVPFAGGAETEQTLRTRLLAQRGLLDMVEESALSPQSLAAAINRAAGRAQKTGGLAWLDGASDSATRMLQWTAEQPW